MDADVQNVKEEKIEMKHKMNDFFSMIVTKLKEEAVEIYNFKNYSVYFDGDKNRYIESKDGNYHFLFNKISGATFKWGKTHSENPTYCPFGNELADIEITKACRGIRNIEGNRIPCKHCYKSNCPNGTYMDFDTFKNIFDKLNEPKTMTQIAFGVDAEASRELNPAIWKIFDYCNENYVTPNVTVADIDIETAKKLVEKCGAVAVSYYGLINKNRCYDSVKLLINEAKKIKKKISINIHCLLSKETYDSVFELINDVHNDIRLKGLNAIVFLSLKQKGRGVNFNKLNNEQFKKIIDTCFENNISFGMDSCSCPKFLESIKDRKDKKQLETFCESCESCLYSCYIDANGIFYPCSFMEKEGEWQNGIDMKSIKNFVNDVWNEDRVIKWRNKSIEQINCNGCNHCPYFDV